MIALIKSDQSADEGVDMNVSKSLRKWGLVFLATASAALGVSQAQAYTVSLTPAAQTVGLGAQVAVGVSVSDLAGMGIGSYQLDIAFDGAILGFDRVVDAVNLGFSVGLGFTSGTGLVSVGDTSFDDPLLLLTRQDDDFLLFTLFFNAIDVGTSALGLTVSALSDVFGTEVAAPLVGNASVTVLDNTGSPASAPGTLVLLLAAAAAAALARRQSAAVR
jgi:hypothetical protein